MTGSERNVLIRVARYAKIAHARAAAHTVPEDLVLGVICQESHGNPYAIRVERGFWRRYGKRMIAMARRTVSRHDDRWMRYPDLAATSYGLMQIMYQTALETGNTFVYPTELCDPERNIEIGCLILARCLRRAGRDEATMIRKALLFYNGGGDREYPTHVWQWIDRVYAAPELFPLVEIRRRA